MAKRKGTDPLYLPAPDPHAVGVCPLSFSEKGDRPLQQSAQPQSCSKGSVPFLLGALSLQLPHSKTAIVVAICGIPFMMFLRGLFSYLNVYLMNWAATRAIADLRLKLFNHLQNLSLDFFQTARTGNLISRIISDTGTPTADQGAVPLPAPSRGAIAINVQDADVTDLKLVMKHPE